MFKHVRKRKVLFQNKTSCERKFQEENYNEKLGRFSQGIKMKKVQVSVKNKIDNITKGNILAEHGIRTKFCGGRFTLLFSIPAKMLLSLTNAFWKKFTKFTRLVCSMWTNTNIYQWLQNVEWTIRYLHIAVPISEKRGFEIGLAENYVWHFKSPRMTV